MIIRTVKLTMMHTKDMIMMMNTMTTTITTITTTIHMITTHTNTFTRNIWRALLTPTITLILTCTPRLVWSVAW